MKELEKTKRISIATVLFILVVLIAVLSYKRPRHIYSINAQHTLEKIVSTDYFVSLNEINNSEHVLIDIRNQFDFEKGHLENAINIYAPEILNEQNSEVFNELKEDNKTLILYGNSPNDVLGPYMLLYQLGYNDLKILTIEINYSQNKLITKDIVIEKSVADVNAFINESVKKAAVKPKPIIKPKPKKVIPVKKKKKKAPEGGC